MAKIYTLNTKDLTLLNFVEVRDGNLSIENYCSIEHSSAYTIEDMQKLKQDFPHYDTYFNSGQRVYSEIHRHSDDEVRLIITGIATFYVPVGNALIIAECSTGDKLTLCPNIDHWFSTNTELFAIRCYGQNDSHVSLKPNVNRIIHNAHHQLASGLNFNF